MVPQRYSHTIFQSGDFIAPTIPQGRAGYVRRDEDRLGKRQQEQIVKWQ